MKKNVEYFNNGQTTVAILTLENGFQVVGKHQQIENFKAEIGDALALRDALQEADKFAFYEKTREITRGEKLKAEEEEIRELMQEMHQKEQQSALRSVNLNLNPKGFYLDGGKVHTVTIADLADEEIKVLKFKNRKSEENNLKRTVFNEPEPTASEKGKYANIFK